MSKTWKLMQKLGRDEDGAALIEYTVLLGILILTVIISITTVGGWINTQWSNLAGKLS